MLTWFWETFSVLARRPTLIIFAVLSSLLSLLVAFGAFAFFADFFTGVLDGTALPKAAGLGFYAGLVQTYPLVLLGLLAAGLVLLAIQIGVAVGLAHIAKKSDDNEPNTGFRSAMGFALSQSSRILWAVIFLAFVLVIILVVFMILAAVTAWNGTLGTVLLALVVLALIYLAYKFIFVFAFWGATDASLKESLASSFAFVSRHRLGTIGVVITLSTIGAVVETVVGVLTFNRGDTVTAIVYVVGNALVTTIGGLCLGFYVIQNSRDMPKTSAPKLSYTGKNAPSKKKTK